MKISSFLGAMWPLIIAFVIGLACSLPFLTFLNWSGSSTYLIFLVFFILGAIPTVSLILLKKRSVPLTLSASWLLWLGLMVPVLINPAVVIETSSGCWASGCDPCTINASACGPVRMPATQVDMLIFFAIGVFFVAIGSLLINLIMIVTTELRSPRS